LIGGVYELIESMIRACCVVAWALKDRQKFILCDEIAVSLALDDQVATSTREVTCSVETAGLFTRGQMIIHRHPPPAASTPVSIVTSLDLRRCFQLLTAAVADWQLPSITVANFCGQLLKTLTT